MSNWSDRLANYVDTKSRAERHQNGLKDDDSSAQSDRQSWDRTKRAERFLVASHYNHPVFGRFGEELRFAGINVRYRCETIEPSVTWLAHDRDCACNGSKSGTCFYTIGVRQTTASQHVWQGR